MARKETIQINFDINTASINELDKELAQINDELKEMKQNDAGFEEKAAEAAKLTNQLNKANAAAEGFTDEKKFQAADGAIKVLAGTLATTVGALGLIGIESEAFAEMEKKAASAIAVGLGLKDLSEGFKFIKESAVLATAKTKLFGITTKQALIATGVGAFVVLLGSVVVYWDDITKAVTKFGEKVPFVGRAIDTVKSAFNSLIDTFRPALEFLGLLPDEAERAKIKFEETTNENIKNLKRQIEVANAEGANAKRIFDLRKRLLEDEIKLLQDKEDKVEELFDKETELLALEAAERKRIADEQAVDTKERNEVKKVSVITTKELTQAEKDNLELQEIVNKKTKENTSAQRIKNAGTESEIEIEEERRYNLGATADALGTLGAVMGEQTAASKALSSAAALINTYLGVTAALKDETIPNTFARIAAAAAILFNGLSAVKNINSTPVSTGGQASPRGSITASAPAIEVSSVAEAAQAAAPETQSVQSTVRAYVLTGDVNSSQEANARLNKRRSLG